MDLNGLKDLKGLKDLNSCAGVDVSLLLFWELKDLKDIKGS